MIDVVTYCVMVIRKKIQNYELQRAIIRNYKTNRKAVIELSFLRR